MTALVDLFMDLDADNNGRVSLQEWVNFSRTKDAKVTLSMIGLDASKCSDIFRLIDWDGSNELERGEFVVGAMQLIGDVQAVDVETLLRNNKKLMTKCIEKFEHLEKVIFRHESLLQREVKDAIEKASMMMI